MNSRERSTNHDGWESVECRTMDPDMWFMDTLETKGVNFTADVINSLKVALNTCNACPMRMECLQLGLNEEDLHYGIWGGYLPGERLAMTGNRHVFLSQRAANIRRMTGVRP